MRALCVASILLAMPLPAAGALSLPPSVCPPQGEPDGGSPVPEPSTLLLVGTGLVGVALTARLRRRGGTDHGTRDR